MNAPCILNYLFWKCAMTDNLYQRVAGGGILPMLIGGILPMLAKGNMCSSKENKGVMTLK